MAIHVKYKITRDYDKVKQDDRVKKMKCVSSNNHMHASIYHTVTF